MSLKTEGRREAALEAALKERAAEAGLAMVVLVTTVESMDAIARLIVRGLHILLTSFEQPQRGLTSTLPRCCSTRNFPTNGLGPTYEAHKFIAHFSTHPIDLRLSSSPARSIHELSWNGADPHPRVRHRHRHSRDYLRFDFRALDFSSAS